MENGQKHQDFLTFVARRKVTNLYKHFLFILEDLKGTNPEMGEEDFQRARKRVLDYGNDAIREIEENIEKFEIRLK